MTIVKPAAPAVFLITDPDFPDLLVAMSSPGTWHVTTEDGMDTKLGMIQLTEDRTGFVAEPENTTSTKIFAIVQFKEAALWLWRWERKNR